MKNKKLVKLRLGLVVSVAVLSGCIYFFNLLASVKMTAKDLRSKF